MKINIAICLDRTAAKSDMLKYFTEDALHQAFNQNEASRETVLFMTTENFLRLVRPGFDAVKESGVKSLLDQGIKFNSLPSLGVETDKRGDVVCEEGRDHEGRHRVRALHELGVKVIPVIIYSKEGGRGPAYRWGKSIARPKQLIGYQWHAMSFPPIETCQWQDSLSTEANIKKIRKVTKDWYRIDLKIDRWDIPTEVVDIYRHDITKDWIVNYCDDSDVGLRKSKASSAWPIAYTKLSSAKRFAIDYAAWIHSGYELPEPKRHADKYD